MSKFLKLTGKVINIAHIQHISHDKTLEKYNFYLAESIYGSFIFGSGFINTGNNSIYATKKEHPESYEAIEKWINSIECISNANKKNKD